MSDKVLVEKVELEDFDKYQIEASKKWMESISTGSVWITNSTTERIENILEYLYMLDMQIFEYTPYERIEDYIESELIYPGILQADECIPAYSDIDGVDMYDNIAEDVEHMLLVEEHENFNYPIALKIFFGLVTIEDIRSGYYDDDHGLPDWIAPEDLNLPRIVIPEMMYYPKARCLFVQDTWFGGGYAYYIGNDIQSSFFVSGYRDKPRWVFAQYREFMKNNPQLFKNNE